MTLATRVDLPVPPSAETSKAVRQLKHDGKPFTFRQLLGCLGGVSKARLRQLLSTPDYTPHLLKQKSLGENTLYTVEGEI